MKTQTNKNSSVLTFFVWVMHSTTVIILRNGLEDMWSNARQSCVSLHPNFLGKGMNPYLLSSLAIDK